MHDLKDLIAEMEKKKKVFLCCFDCGQFDGVLKRFYFVTVFAVQMSMVHKGCHCIMCGCKPIRGTRYRCLHESHYTEPLSAAVTRTAKTGTLWLLWELLLLFILSYLFFL
jgi:hypothetical protein